jgi:SAM-dependent methyltransferase
MSPDLGEAKPMLTTVEQSPSASEGSREDQAPEEYREQRSSHWNRYATRVKSWLGWWGRYYHRRLAEVYKFLVPPGQRVLELGCAQGDLLAALEPAMGVGVDFSTEMVRAASARHPHLCFVQADAHDLPLDETFDVIILSDLVNDLWDVQTVLQQVARLSGPQTRVILNSYSRLWQPVLALAQRLGVAQRLLPQNWLTTEDVRNLLHLADLEIIRSWGEILCPLPVPLLGRLCNRYLVKLWPFCQLALTRFFIGRPVPQGRAQGEEPLVSVIVPARNEAGNMSHILDRIPEIGAGTEVVFVEGHSTDDTYGAIEATIAAHPERRCKLVKQSGKGKGDAVRLGFAEAEGDVLMILDADLTVPPEDLPRFYEALRSGKGDFINGVRLVYPMENQAMRFLNLVGNKFFSLTFSWLLGQPIKDTLCGTKVLWKSDYELIAANRSYFGDFDPFGDFDLLFGAAKLSLKIVEVPIRYRQRSYGTTNISRFTHGWLLLKMSVAAARKLVFI